MANPTLFVHTLRSWEKARLLKEFKRARDPRYRDRLDAVLLSSESWSVPRIARAFGKAANTVQMWIHDFNRLGFDGLKVGQSPGRPRKIDADAEACLVDAVSQNPRDMGYRFTRWSLPLLAEHLYRELHVRVSPSCVSQALHRLRYAYKRPKHSLRHRQNRRKVCRVRRERDALLKKSSANPTAMSFSSKTSASSISIPA